MTPAKVKGLLLVFLQFPIYGLVWWYPIVSCPRPTGTSLFRKPSPITPLAEKLLSISRHFHCRDVRFLTKNLQFVPQAIAHHCWRIITRKLQSDLKHYTSKKGDERAFKGWSGRDYEDTVQAMRGIKKDGASLLSFERAFRELYTKICHAPMKAKTMDAIADEV